MKRDTASTSPSGPWQSVTALLRRVPKGLPPVGQTPHDVVWRENKWRLLRFASATPRYAAPILMVPSLINRWYVLDLAKGRSLVEWLIGQGFVVYVIDWGTPGPEDRYVTLDDIAVGVLGRAVRHVTRAAGTPPHVLGYCLGGTLATCYAATGASPLASLTLLAAPIDFTKAGMLASWARHPQFDVRAMTQSFGNMPWLLMQVSFHLLRPTGSAAKLVALLDRAWDDEYLDGFLATERWGNDNVSFPGACYAEYIQKLYRENQLLHDTLELAGQRASLSSITAPLHVVAFANDSIVPAAAALAITDRVGSRDTQELLLAGGHVGAVVSRKAMTHLWPHLAAFWSAREPRPSAPLRAQIAAASRLEPLSSLSADMASRATSAPPRRTPKSRPVASSRNGVGRRRATQPSPPEAAGTRTTAKAAAVRATSLPSSTSKKQKPAATTRKPSRQLRRR